MPSESQDELLNRKTSVLLALVHIGKTTVSCLQADNMARSHLCTTMRNFMNTTNEHTEQTWNSSRSQETRTDVGSEVHSETDPDPRTGLEKDEGLRK